jgi:hypothetical protein
MNLNIQTQSKQISIYLIHRYPPIISVHYPWFHPSRYPCISILHLSYPCIIRLTRTRRPGPAAPPSLDTPLSPRPSHTDSVMILLSPSVWRRIIRVQYSSFPWGEYVVRVGPAHPSKAGLGNWRAATKRQQEWWAEGTTLFLPIRLINSRLKNNEWNPCLRGKGSLDTALNLCLCGKGFVGVGSKQWMGSMPSRQGFHGIYAFVARVPIV